MNSLKNKVAIVTGAGRGIGREIAIYLAKNGAKVVVNDLGREADGTGKSVDVAKQTVDMIREFGGKAIPNMDSVTELENAERMVQTAVDEFGGIDIVVNNAGIVRDRMIFNMSEEEWDAVIAVHLKGSFNLTKAAAPIFKEQKSGRFINFTSTSGLIGNIGQANYAAAKLGIVGLTKSTAIDMARYNVTANAIAPFAWSRLVGTKPAETEEQQKKIDLLKKLSPEFIAPVVAYLASDDAQDVTGQIFGVRGKEIFLFSQFTPIRTAFSKEGWTFDALSRVKQTFQPDFTEVQTSGDLFNWDPLV